MERDLRAAARIQEAFLPRGEPRFPRARFAWHYRPCEELAGDGLNVFALDDRHAALYVFDVSGHGVASALLSVSLSRVLSPPSDPSSVLRPDAGDGRARADRPPDAPGRGRRPAEPDVPLRRGDRAVLHDDLRGPRRGDGRVPLRLGGAPRRGARPGRRAGPDHRDSRLPDRPGAGAVRGAGAGDGPGRSDLPVFRRHPRGHGRRRPASSAATGCSRRSSAPAASRSTGRSNPCSRSSATGPARPASATTSRSWRSSFLVISHVCHWFADADAVG